MGVRRSILSPLVPRSGKDVPPARICPCFRSGPFQERLDAGSVLTGKSDLQQSVIGRQIPLARQAHNAREQALMDIRKPHGPGHGSARTGFTLKAKHRMTRTSGSVGQHSGFELIHPSEVRKPPLWNLRRTETSDGHARVPMDVGRGRNVEGVKAALQLSNLGYGSHSCLRFRGVGAAGRFKAQPAPHGLRPHPHVSPSGNPRSRHLKFWGDEDTMVRAPATSLLRNAVFQDRDPRTKKAPNNGLNHSCPQVKALKAWGSVEGLHECGLVEG